VPRGAVLSRRKQGKHGPVARPNPRELAPAALTWLVLLGLWMLLSGSLVVSELIVGAVAATIGAGAFEAVRRQGLVRFHPRARWLRRAWRLPFQVFSDAWVVWWAALKGLVLRRPVRGRFREVPFRTGGTDGRSSARRTLATMAASLSANTYVVDLDTENGTLLIHELVARSPEAQIP
jgi:multisubunit Na+/H+ antiporter MnhE subunit